MFQKSIHRSAPRPTRFAFTAASIIAVLICLSSAATAQQVLGDPVDVSRDFQKMEQVYFVGDKVTGFDPASGQGTLRWARYLRQTTLSFNKVDVALTKGRSTEFPGTEYDESPTLPFTISFVNPRTVRLRFTTRDAPIRDQASLMLAATPAKDDSWKVTQTDKDITYTSAAGGKVRIVREPWHVEFYDAAGKLLTRTQNVDDPKTYFTGSAPFSFVRRASDLGRSIAATFQLAHDEKLYGTGESFTRLDKRGQKIVAYTRDGMGVQNAYMYKPVPFFMSNRGYGMFVHTSTPVTFDFGHTFDAHNVIYTGDENLDIFVFLGDPKQVLSDYTALTGRPPMPPLWSFGLWMSRITYKAEDEVRDVAAKLRQHRIPSDVIHLDTGWFETDWRSNYKFSTSRFRDPAQMIADLKRQGFRISLWQYPYFSSKNEIYKEAVARGYVVKNEGGQLPFEDAVLDMSNPEAVRWYQGLIANLLKMGVGAIKVDFGEGAPASGLYASGRTGLYEHNLYPLRYNKAVADITKQVTGDSIIWARAAWAGSQRYPVHWGGDAENTDSAMAASLHWGNGVDAVFLAGVTGAATLAVAAAMVGIVGGGVLGGPIGTYLVERTPRDLYSRWLPFGMLTSHSRAHGAPPKEPWEYDERFVDEYRRGVELKYRLMPYVYAQAKDSAERGHPMLRTLFFEYPNDPTSWMIEDEYMFGSEMLVAPLMEAGTSRNVYVPPGRWIDYQSGKPYMGAQWHRIAAGEIPVVLLVKEHAVIPHAQVAQSTADIDWNDIELRVFSTDDKPLSGLFALPNGDLQTLKLTANGSDFAVSDDPLRGKVRWRIKRAETR